MGVGASAAVNVAVNTTRSAIEQDAKITGARDVTLSAFSDHTMETEAEAGSAGGIAVTPVAGVSVAVNKTEAVLEAGSLPENKLDITGTFTASARHEGSTSTKAEGQAEGEDVAVGLALAVTTSVDEVTAETKRSIGADGDITFEAISLVAGSASAVAGAEGGKGLDGKSFNPSDNVDKDTEKITIQGHGFTEGSNANPGSFVLERAFVG